MSALCNGKVLREGHVWSCLDCGCIGTAWSTQHTPMLSKPALFLSSLAEAEKEAAELVIVAAVQPAS